MRQLTDNPSFSARFDAAPEWHADRWAAAMLLDVKMAWRGLLARPLFTLVAVTTLAVGIGANAAIFSVVHAVLLRPLPYPASDRLVALYTRYLPATGYDFPYFALSGPELLDVRNRTSAFTATAAYGFAFRNAESESGSAERILTMPVTADLFDILGTPPVWGRTFTHDEAERTDACVAVLEFRFSQRHFGSSPAPGSTIRLDDRPCEVVGVMPEGFGFRDERVQLWTALAIDTDEGSRASHPLLAIARVRDDVSFEQTHAQLQSLHEYWSEQFPEHYAKGHFAVIRPLHEDIVGDQRQTLLLLGGAVGFVLLIVCANIAGLVTSRSEARRREFALRRALGADRRCLVRLLLSETVLLALAGGALGLLLANWFLDGLLALYPAALPAMQPLRIDRRVVLFALSAAGLAGFAIGLVPALHASGVRMQETLKADGSRVTAGGRAIAFRSALVAGQIALSVVLLALALLLVRSYRNLQAVDLGFDPRGLLTFNLSVPAGRQPDPAAARRMLVQIEERLEALPDADRAGAISALPLASAGPPDDFVIEGRPAPAPGEPAWNGRYIMATPRAFEALRIPLERGRLLRDSDAAGRPQVAVISETAARLYWPNEDPLGQRIKYFPIETSQPVTIVGIVGDVRSLGANAAPPPVVYVPFEQAPREAYDGRSMTFVVRARTSPEAITASARVAVASVDANLPMANVRSMETVVERSLGEPRFANTVMWIFAGMAVFLSALGLYGMLAYHVEQRRREIGIRVALGANPQEIRRLVAGRGLVLTAIGLTIGVPASLGSGTLLSGLLVGVTPADPVTHVGVAAILGAAALLASYLPALRATRVDPIVVLKE